MKHRLYNNQFPTPKFLNMSSVGLDISDESIKFAELRSGEKGLRLGRFGERKISPGVIESGKIRDGKKLGEILKFLQKDENFDFIRVSLPEEQMYTFELTIPKVNRKEIYGAIELQLEEHVPISAKETIFDYDLIKEEANSYRLQVSAIPQAVIDSYMNIFKGSGLRPLSFELEAASIGRAVVPAEDKGTYMIVDFGETRTSISVASEGLTLFTSTIDIGGSTITKMIQKNFNVNFEEAEKMKKKYGLRRSLKGNDVCSIILSDVCILRDEINKNYIYWHSHKDENNKERKKIEKIILCGEDSNLVGFKEYLSTSLRAKVRLADAWVNINSFDRYIPEINFKESLGYVTALGLALGDYEYD